MFMYCFLIPGMLGLAYALYLALNGGNTMDDEITTIAVAFIAAAATITTGIITNHKSVRDLKNSVDSMKELFSLSINEKSSSLMDAIYQEHDKGYADLSKEHDRLSKEHDGLSKEHDGLSKEHDGLSKEHAELIRSQLRTLDETGKIVEYVSRQEGYVKTASERNVDLNNLTAQIISMAQRLDDADTERKHMQAERDQAIRELEKIRSEMREHDARKEEELKKTKKQLREAYKKIETFRGYHAPDIDEQGPELYMDEEEPEL